jgi:hypothetical protein
VCPQSGHVAGIPTALDAAHTASAEANALAEAEYITEQHAASNAVGASYGVPGTPRSPGGSMPAMVGMTRQAAYEAKRAWRLELQGAPPPDGCHEAGVSTGLVAGLSSEARARTVRGHVGPQDPGSAAEYNLQVKLASKGNESARPAVAPPPFADMSNSVVTAPAAQLTHAERLAHMRALRQGGTPRQA